ncbi:GD11352 [Drosophila simulans]|uniref:GD11352 n=1 Tax=Drosophila simulans TaxID=7240 RepID=B4QCB2_DROSI|nr:GD11352 [Drosophila simulans]
MQISELIKLAKSSSSSSGGSLRSGSGSRIIIKFDINNIRNRCSALCPPLDPLGWTVC